MKIHQSPCSSVEPAITGRCMQEREDRITQCLARRQQLAGNTLRSRASIGQAARSVRNQAAETSEGVQAVADTFYTAIKTSLQRQPMTTLGFAVAMGFVLGALWKA